MKLSNRLIAKKLTFKFSTTAILTVLILSINIANAQSQKTFIDEIEASTGVTVESNLPTSLDVNIKGKMVSNNTKDRYTINGKEDQIRININKELEIKTWKKNIVRQETTIKVKAATKDEEDIILEKLKLSLKEKADSIVIIDCNLNMKEFKMSNGFFTNEKCEITLDNDQSYQIEYLEIETKLTIPKESNLSVKGVGNSKIILGELFGDVELDLKYAEVYGSNVRNLKCSLKACYNVNFNTVAFADLSAINSHINIKKAVRIHIGIHAFYNSTPYKHDEPRYIMFDEGLHAIYSNSAQTKYIFGTVDILHVNKSGNDEIFADEVAFLEANTTSYTNFQIKKLNTSLLINARNSDIAISSVDKEFTKIEINNKLSDININMVEEAEYTLTINRDKYVEADLNDKLTLHSEKGASKDIYGTKNNSSDKLIKINCEDCKLQIR